MTLPPSGFFGGLDRRRADDQVIALKALGATVYAFETSAVYRKDYAEIDRQISQIKEFKPDAVIGAQHAGYAIQGGMIESLDGALIQNLFLDILALPTVFYWDHILTQAARYLIATWPRSPAESVSGVVSKLKALMAHPLAIHFLPDSGHLTELNRLGLASFAHDPLFVTAVSQVFVQHGKEAHGAPTHPEAVSFFGNLYLSATNKIPYGQMLPLNQLRQHALHHCKTDWNIPAYDAYRQAIRQLAAEKREALRLDIDQSFYWRFLYDELSIVANGGHRACILAACQRPIAFFGGFADPESSAAIASRQWMMRDSLAHDRSLAEAYRSSTVTIDVVNAPFINGFSPKLLECYASGGFLLTTRKKDIATAFGDLAEAIGYSNAEELAAKTDYYLSHDDQRRAITREMQNIIRHNHTAAALFSRTLPRAIEMFRASRN